ncbi:MAG: right-handed parallel beta-helix repeat-containing protein [Planctomycetota bacterium]
MKSTLRKFGWLACVGLSFWATVPAFGIDLFVNNRVGNDRYAGTSPTLDAGLDGPFRTLDGAWQQVKPGDRIILMPTDSPYRVDAVLSGVRVQGRPNFPIILEGNGVELVGTIPIAPEDWRYFRRGAYVLEGPFQGQRPIMIGGRPAQKVESSPWGNLPELSPGQYLYWRGTTVFQADPMKSISDYPLEQNQLRFGLLLERVSHITVRNLRVRGYSHDGVQVRGPAKGIVFERCLFADNGRAGVSLYNNAEVQFTGCFIEGNVRAGVLNDNFSQLKLESTAVQATPTDVVTDDTSRLTITGTAPPPLDNGPFVYPAPRPGQSEPNAPAEGQPAKENPGFFDPN